MHRFELVVAAVFGAAFTAFRLFPGSWCEPFPVRLVAGVFVVATAMLYLWFVDDKRRPKAGAVHRVLVGGSAGLIVAAIANGTSELYALLALVGTIAGYIGFRWLKHVPL
jgi:hypothetical protein